MSVTSQSPLDDLAYIRTLAEEGRYAPLIGGRIGLMWGVLLSATLLLHGLTALGMSGLAIEAIGFIWLAFGVIGGISTAILRRTLKGKPGQSAVGNKVEGAVWTASAIAIFTLAIAITISVVVNDLPYWTYDFIMAFSFGTYAVSYFVLAGISGVRTLYVPSALALALTGVVVLMVGNPWVYIVAAVGVILTLVLPALNALKHEPKNVV